MKVLIADRLPSWVPVRLQEMDIEVENQPSLKEEELANAMNKSDILVVRSTRVLKDVIQNNPELMLIIRAGAGTNTVDVGEASERGVYVANTPGQNAAAVAELTLGLLLAIDRKIPAANTKLKDGQWDKKGFSNCDGLWGRTMGIIGFGRIGQATAERVSAFGMNVIVWSRSLSGEAQTPTGVKTRETVLELCRDADVVSLHIALNDETRGILGAKELEAMKDNAIVLNTSRGGLIDRDALLDAIEKKGLRVGLDVYDDEPGAGDEKLDDPVALHPRVVGTHHIGASTRQAQDAVASEVVRIIQTFKTTGHVPNCVNLAKETPAKFQLIVRHEDRVGVLAGVLDVLKKNTINVQEMENTIFERALAASCSIQVDNRPSDDVLEELRTDLPGVLGVQIVKVE